MVVDRGCQRGSNAIAVGVWNCCVVLSKDGKDEGRGSCGKVIDIIACKRAEQGKEDWRKENGIRCSGDQE